MTPTPRLAPLPPPYAADVAETLEALRFGMPEPLALFRTLAHAPRVLDRVRRGGLLDRGPVPLRLRELMILRTTARCGADYEWGVHVAAYAAKARFTEVELRETALLPSGATGGFSGDDALVLRLADALHEHARVEDALYAELAAALAPDALVELVALAGFYHLISFELNVLGVVREPFAPEMPRP
ncbi:MAG: carboxymuconolactone decarboxylase family protein [Sandaracinus sp.]